MSDMAVEVLKQQLADLTRDYTGACEAIRQLEANVAEARAEVERTNHIMRLERMARQDSEDRLKAQLTAAEAAREAVLASLAAAEAVAGEVREMAAQSADFYARIATGMGFGQGYFVGEQIRALPLPTPSAALQRVREQAYQEGYNEGRKFPMGQCEAHAAASFPTPDAGGAA